MRNAVVQWLAPQALWDAYAARARRPDFRRPAILRFASDAFIEEARALLEGDPARLADHVARHETWREPGAGLAAEVAAADGERLLKLYQPTHQRYYLVASALTCRLPTLPDHTVLSGQGEETAFVVRRVVPEDDDGDVADPTKRREYAWVPGDRGWVEVTTPGLVAGEERLPLFPMVSGTSDQRRRMFAGLIPVSRREAYVSGREAKATANQNEPPGPLDEPRLIEFQRLVIDPWADLLDWFDNRLSAEQKTAAAAVTSIEQASALILLDFATFLEDAIPEAWDAVKEAPSPALGPARDLFDALAVALTDYRTGFASTNLRDAIRLAKDNEAELEAATLEATGAAPLPAEYPRVRLTDANPALRALMERLTDDGPRRLVDLVAKALPPRAAAALHRLPARAPASPQGDAWFVIYCVYRRPQCGPGAPPLLSRSTVPFRMASFFDADAPARSLDVALPVDTTPSGLRKFDKNVAFKISDELAKQMNRIKGIQALEDGDLAPPGPGLGMICSLSIPIITICAFLLLMIIVQLLNIVFFWLPFFKICFPLPSLKAKGGG